MRYATLALAVLLVPAAAADVHLRFQEPATLEGDLGGMADGWFAARIPEGARIKVDLVDPGRLVMTNYTFPARLELPVSSIEPGDAERQSSSTAFNPMAFELVAGQGGATLGMVFAGQLQGSGKGHVVGLKEGGLSGALGSNGQDLNKGWSGWSTLSTNGVALVSQGSLRQVAFDGLQVEALEWFNVIPSCPPGRACPEGGGSESRHLGTQGAYVVSTTYRFERLEGPILASAAWDAAEVAFAGPSLDLWTNGQVHLPVADGTACPTCPPIRDQTLTIGGVVRVDDIQNHADGFAGHLSGDFESARIDEEWVSPERLGQAGVAGAAVIGLAIVVKLLLVPLFTRLSKQEALEHPKRQKIFHYIQDHPGANFREVARQTSIAAGTVRHHLTVLERAGHVVEHQHQGTVRLFENHGKFDHNWADLVLLREPPLAKLHTWLKAHPGSPQKAALEAMEAEGWSRSTTQHRLSRLVEGGLATIRLQGRLKIYTAAERVAPKPGLAVILPTNPALVS